ncbi:MULTISPECIES: hypothetical protein [unclassified Streptococcus]|uniref:hypothetical protein n=1 Tax=unclassified Streptococcus TaxID=2608887 RepID=UPI0010718321|nr:MULTISPECIES: hypothetical protein [unclassified Streptococcus]MBF0786682.1 hypothetical protein [Streptococcus sp. 19428wC2_LYSM12]MCQ9211696.1 hypothetical protein [Streptococcus sp. B01]MCQ9213115.1 hypothetical protein [Streptococcus sp. O1]TFV06434.1 hypothetical protein E4T79_01915 [Streptococcus sp. LYSM12]
MREDKKMHAHVTKSGYKYYTPRRTASEAPQAPKESKWKKGARWTKQALLAGFKNLPGLIMRAAVLMVTTPLMILLFILNLIKSLIATAIGWFVFKVASYFILGFGIAGYTFLIQKDIPAPEWFNNMMTDFVFPHGIPIYYWWETTIIVVLSVITALSLTLYPNEA